MKQVISCLFLGKKKRIFRALPGRPSEVNRPWVGLKRNPRVTAIPPVAMRVFFSPTKIGGDISHNQKMERYQVDD